MLYESSDDARPLEYINVLQQIEAMRMVCNLGLHYHDRRSLGAVAKNKLDNWAVAAQQTFNLQGEIGGMQCRYCFAVTDTSASLLNDTRSQQPLQLSKCLQLICFDCISIKRPIDCGHSPSCEFARVYLNPNSLEETSLSLNHFDRAESLTQALKLPLKVTALVAQLKSLPPGVKRYALSHPSPNLHYA
jgi:hypothetical protein